MAYELKELSKEEGEQLTKELQEVLAKYNAEMGVSSSIQLLKRVEITEPILSPIQPKDLDGNTDTKTEEDKVD